MHNALNEQPIVRPRAPNVAFSAGQHILDPIPLIIAF
jgi:hypothetical protein